MITFFLLCFSFFLNPHIINIATANKPYTPAEHILLNCGSPSTLNASDGQSWEGDIGTKYSPDINNGAISILATAAEQDPSINGPVPYMTVQIFLSRFSYSFSVSPGQKMLRLYFYPATYSGGYLKNQSFFSVTGNQYSLLSNFSAYLAVAAQETGSASLVKEFVINVGQIQVLNVTFVPAANSYAFVNGIEVVSIPDNFYMGIHDMKNNPLRFVNGDNQFYELNVGGKAISAVDDTGMFRRWFQDDEFIGEYQGNTWRSNDTISLQYTSQTPNYTAPSEIYITARTIGILANICNLTWSFPVDSGFNYLLRLHFCEFDYSIINATNQRQFTISINHRTAETRVDIIRWTGGTGIPIFRDYVVLLGNSNDSSQSKQDLVLILLPDFGDPTQYFDAILNGLEIFKLNTTAGNLAGPNPNLHDTLLTNSRRPELKKSKGHIRIIVSVVGEVVGGCVILIILAIVWFYQQRRPGTKDFDRKSSNKLSWTPIPHEKIKSATANFDSSNLIGTGGFGNVYKGYINNNLSPVAIKRLHPSSRQGTHEFWTEIEMLSNLRHLHLVSLIGYGDEKGEMILVYDYMGNGTLRDHLYETQNPQSRIKAVQLKGFAVSVCWSLKVFLLRL